MNKRFQNFKRPSFPAGKLIIPALIIIWLVSGIFIVEPGEVGVVLRFGAFSRITSPGPHYHMPYPVESVKTVKVTEVRRLEIGFRAFGSQRTAQTKGRIKSVPDESQMLTGDENIVDVQYTVQYKIKDAVNYLFNVYGQENTVKEASEAAMREVVGKINIDTVLTTGKDEIQTQTRDLIQDILDLYKSGIHVVTVKLQNVQPPGEVSQAFKDVASAREDRSRYINEAEAYRNGIIPQTRGQASVILNNAQAYKEATILKAKGEASKFTSILKEYQQAKDVTKKRLYIETMEKVLSNPDMEKIIISNKALNRSVPLLPLGQAQTPLTNGGGKK